MCYHSADLLGLTVICEIQSVNEKVGSGWDIFHDTFPQFTLSPVISFITFMFQCTTKADFHHYHISMYVTNEIRMQKIVSIVLLI
jgi:hypothetical protein